MDKNIKFQHFASRKPSGPNQTADPHVSVDVGSIWGGQVDTFANALEQELNKKGKHTYILDGDNLRHGLNSDLGFTETDRNENVRELPKLPNSWSMRGLL